MKIPYLSGLRVSGKVELKNLSEQVNATKYLTIDANNNVTWSNGGGGSGSVDLSNYFTKSQSDVRYQPIGNYLTSVQWSDVINKPTFFDGNYNSLTNKPAIPSLTSQLTNDSGFVTASIVHGYATEQWVLNKNYLTAEADTLDSVLGRGNTSSKNINVFGVATFNGQLIIPSTASNQNQSIWIGNANSTGNTAPLISYLNDLSDVTIGNVSNGQALVYENGIWLNKNVVTDLSNYYTIAASNARFKPLNYVPTWDEVLNKPNIPSTAGLASVTYVDNKVADLVASAPSTLDTLSELANALGNDANFSTTILNQIGSKANISDVYSKATADSKFHPIENQRLSVSDNVVFAKVKASNELVIPATSSATNQSIWLGEAGSVGNIPAGNITTLASLQDVAFSNLANGESLVYDSNSGKWLNKKFALAGDYVLQSQLYNYYTKTQTDSRYKDINWLPTWNQVTGKPTNLSQFVNDLGNYGGFLLSDGATYAGFAGNNVDVPYMRHTTSNSIVYLARKAELGALAYENKVYKHYSIDNQHYYLKHSWDGTGWNLRSENDVADQQPNIHLVNINGKSENSTAWNGQRYSSSELTTPSTWFLGYDANTGEWKPTGKNVINSFLGLGSAAFKDENSWLKPSNHPNTAANYNFAIGTDGTRNFIQSHSGLELQINPLGNKVVLNNATVLNDLVIPATPSGANQSIWLGAAGSNSNNPSGYITTLASLQDVSFNNLQNGQSISYDASTGKWKNTTYQAAGNYALTDGSNIITTSFRANLGLGSLAYRSEVPRADVAGWSLAQRNGAGDLYARYYNMQAGSPDEAPIANYVYTDADGFLRKSSVGALRGWIGLGGNTNGDYLRIVKNEGLNANTQNINAAGKLFAGSNVPSGGNDYGSFLSYGVDVYTTQFSSPPNANGRVSVRVNGDGGTGLGTWQTIVTDNVLGTAAYGAYDWISVVGIASNNLNEPYMRRASDGAMAWLVNRDTLGSGAYLNATLVHRYNTFTADANTVAEHTSNFSYANNAPWNGYLGHFGANGYGLQLSAAYGDSQISFRTRNGDVGAWNVWRELIHSGNIANQVVANVSTPTSGYKHIGAWGVGRTDTGAILVNTAYSADYSNYLNLHKDISLNSTVLSGVFRNEGGMGDGVMAYSPVLNLSGDDTGWQIQADFSNISSMLMFRGRYANTFSPWRQVYNNGDIGRVKTDLGLGESAYTAETLNSVSARGNQIDRDINFGSYNELGIKWAYNGDYAKLYYENSVGNGKGKLFLDISDDNLYDQGFMIRGKRYDNAIANTAYFSANGSSIFYGQITSQQGIDVRGGGAVVYFDGSNSYGARADTRGQTLHQYVWRASDGAALAWSENWYDGSKYHNWSTDSLGFVASSKITAISSGSGADTYAGALEVRGTNAGITFHYPGYFATSLWMNTVGELSWNGNAFRTNGNLYANNNITAGNDVSAPHVYGNNFVAGTRVYAGYDSGLAGSVNASNWFRSSGENGWYNSTYQGGIYMSDFSWVRIYGSKGFLVENTVRANQFEVENNIQSRNYGSSLVGIYSPTKYQGVFSMGDSWKLPIDGSSAGNLYGLAWSHEYAGGQTKGGLGHQLLIMENGITQVSVGNGIWTRANIYAAGQVEAPAMKATDRMIIPTIAPVAPVSGCIWIS